MDWDAYPTVIAYAIHLSKGFHFFLYYEVQNLLSVWLVHFENRVPNLIDASWFTCDISGPKV